MAASIVRFINLSRRGSVVIQEITGGFIQGLGQNFCSRVSRYIRQVFQRRRKGKKLAKRIPTQVIFFLELLHMFWCGAAGTGFKKPSTVHQRHD